MSTLETLLQRPANFSDQVFADDWMPRIAQQLLAGSQLMVANKSHRLVEIEFYYSGDGHVDPFAHADPLQLKSGHWYFHRHGGSYRNGSFKGLDLTFGDGAAFGGILIRALETADGALIDGPSLCVDHLLATAGLASVSALAELVRDLAAWDVNNPLALITTPSADSQTILRTARVGLSLKKVGESVEPMRYIIRPYRFLSEPRRVRKGKVYLVLALHRQGYRPDEIKKMTGCPRKSIELYIEQFQAGAISADFAPLIGVDFGATELSRLHGVWHSKYCDSAK